jgi:hypothetical protein
MTFAPVSGESPADRPSYFSATRREDFDASPACAGLFGPVAYA